MSDQSTVEVVLDELADLAELVGKTLGHGTAAVVAQVSALVFRSAGDVVHVVRADELERIRQSRATGMAAGGAAYAASNQNFARRCEGCGYTLNACNAVQPPAVKCCPDCRHPGP